MKLVNTGLIAAHSASESGMSLDGTCAFRPMGTKWSSFSFLPGAIMGLNIIKIKWLNIYRGSYDIFSIYFKFGS